MTASLPVTNPTDVWRRFLNALKLVLTHRAPQDTEGPARAFDLWRDRVLKEMATPSAVEAVAGSLTDLLNGSDTRLAGELMLLELQAFIDYVESRTAATSASASRESTPPRTFVMPDDKQFHRESLGVAGTLLDSLNDLLDKLPFHWKALLKALGEIASIVKDFAR